MSNNTLIDYEKTNKYLPESLRAFVGASDRMSRQDFRQFITMFRGLEQLAVFNNQTAAEFASGFTNLNYKYLRSGAAPRLMDVVVSKTVGRVWYQCEPKEADFNAILDSNYFSDCLYKAFEEAAMTGRSLLVAYKNEDEYNLASYNLFRHKIVYDHKNNVQEAWLYLVKIDGENIGYENVICEHRYYKTTKEERTPYQEFLVYSIQYDKSDKKNATQRILDRKEIDDGILAVYPDVEFNIPRELDMPSIGVYDIKYTKTNKKFLDCDIPEAMFTDAVDNVLVLDTSITGKEVEKEIGRGQILIPEFGKGQDFTSYQTQGMVGSNVLRTISRNYKNPIIMSYPTMKMEDSKPSNIQFDIRSEQWIQQIDNDTARLCASVGVSVLDYDPRLLATGQRTDDEINAMTDITANTVTKFRNINQAKVNQLLSDVAITFNFGNRVAIRWSMSSILNPSKNTALVIQQLTNGLIPRKEAIRRVNPDLTDAEVEQLYNEILKEQQAQDVNVQFNNF